MKWKNKRVTILHGGSLSGNMVTVANAVNDNALVLKEAIQKIDELSEEIERLKTGGADEDKNYTKGNEDNIDKAIQGLDQFAKNWCMDYEETEKMNIPAFRCDECNFKSGFGICKIKEFVVDKTGDIQSDFGYMSR